MHMTLAIVLLLFITEGAWAQDSLVSDPRLQVLISLEPSARLRIAFTDSLEVQGTYLGAEAGLVRLSLGEQDRSFSVTSISKISERGRFTWTGGILGAVVGAAVAGGIAAGIASIPAYCESGCDEQLEPALRAAPIGAIIGTASAFVVQDSRWHQRFP